MKTPVDDTRRGGARPHDPAAVEAAADAARTQGDAAAKERAARDAQKTAADAAADPTDRAAEAARKAAQHAEAVGASVPTVAPPADAEVDPVDRALARLAHSRESLRHVMIPPRAARFRPDDVASAGRFQWPRPMRLWMARARRWMGDSPVAMIALDSVQTWWQRQPLRVAGEALGSEVGESLRPVIRRHPAISAALAAGAGAALVAARPWEWRWLGEQMHTLPKRALRWTMLQLAHAPVQTLLAGLVLARTGKAVADKAADVATQPETPAHPAP